MKILRTLALLFFLTGAATPSLTAQTKNGSQVLQQDGSDDNPAKNGPYHYESVRDVSGVDKAEMFKRVKNWILTNLKLYSDNVVFDEASDLISINYSFLLEDINTFITNQTVSGKIVFNFRDGKMRAKGTDFLYYGLEDQMYHNKKINRSSFHQLPLVLSKKQQRKIYAEFDAAFTSLVSNAFTAAGGGNSDKW